MADTEVFTTFEGDNTILIQLVAKSLLTDYRDSFGELNAVGTAAFVANQVWETVAEKSALRELIGRLTDDLVPGREGEEDLLDREYHKNLFLLARGAHPLRRGAAPQARHRRRAGRLRRLQRVPGPRPLRRPRAHRARDPRGVRRRRSSAARTKGSRRSSASSATSTPDEIERDRGWFQEHGRISSTRARRSRARSTT